MEIVIEKEPPTLAEIEAEKNLLETELIFLYRYRKKGKIIRVVIPLILFVCFFLWSPFGNFISAIGEDHIINRNPTFFAYWFERLICSAMLGSISTILFNMAPFGGLDQIPFLIKKKETLVNLFEVNHINKSHAVQIVEICKTHPEIDNYRLKVVALKRPLINAEFEAIQDWVKDIPVKSALGQLQKPGPIQELS